MRNTPEHSPDEAVESLHVLTPEEVSDLLTVPVKTLYAWRGRSEGPPAFKVGRHLRYLLGDLTVWIDARRDEDPHKSS